MCIWVVYVPNLTALSGPKVILEMPFSFTQCWVSDACVLERSYHDDLHFIGLNLCMD